MVRSLNVAPCGLITYKGYGIRIENMVWYIKGGSAIAPFAFHDLAECLSYIDLFIEKCEARLYRISTEKISLDRG